MPVGPGFKLVYVFMLPIPSDIAVTRRWTFAELRN
jgi:hypothetical protein